MLNFRRRISTGPDAGLHVRAFEVKSQAPIDDLYVDVHVAIILDGRDPGPRLDVSAATGEAIWYPLALV